MNELIDSISGLAPEQIALLKLRLEKITKDNSASNLSRIIAHKRESDTLPLSPQQQGDWFYAQLNPTATSQNISLVKRVLGPLDVDALERSLDEIVRRHEILRTNFVAIDGNPVQIASATSRFKLSFVDLSALPAAERETSALHLATEESQINFDLTSDSLLRALLIRLQHEQHVLVLTVHHIICDRWSHGILMNELLTLYLAFTTNSPSHLPELPVQYADFVLWQHEWLQSENMRKQLTFWKNNLEGASFSLNLPTDHSRSTVAGALSKKYPLKFSRELTQALRTRFQREGTTPFVVLLAALNTLLFRLTGQEDIVVGSMSANRNHPEIEHLIGLFANTVLMRAKPAAALSFRQLLQQVSEMSLDTQANQDLPFEILVRELQPERKLASTPLFQVVFNLQKAPKPELSLSNLSLSQIEITQEWTNLDMFWLLEETEHTIAGVLEYNARIFDDDTVEDFAAAFFQILETAVREPETLLSQFTLPDKLLAKTRAAEVREEKQTIAIAATFTAEPLEEVLAFWMQELDIPAQFEFMPYNQVFQQLLDPTGPLARNERGINIVLLRFEDWQRQRTFEERAKVGSPAEIEKELERNARDFVRALSSAVERNSVPHIVCICPSAHPSAADLPASLTFIEELLLRELAPLNGVYLISPSIIDNLYKVREPFDKVRDNLGHVPYTPSFFTALGTMIARTIHAIQSPPSKVVIVDCDQTLWKGVCAEDGVRGVEVDAPRRAFQQFLAAQQEAGMLLCLCSKNNERDVVEVFEHCPDMLLKLDQFVARRINWAPKSENIRRLAQDLNLGLDSFIFIDDNPLECAEVSVNCPGVLSLQLPAETESIPNFLKHVWAFDRTEITVEDKNRTALYQQNLERERYRQESLTLADFFADLDLQIQVSKSTPVEATRLSQLTQRTNQFNTTLIRRSEVEIQRLIQSSEHQCLSVTVKDRFGDYGLVGAVIAADQNNALEVDTLLLSCRVLGRGVEHRVISELGWIAREKKLEYLNIAYRCMERNQPARDFLETIGTAFSETRDDSYIFKLPVQHAVMLKFEFESDATPVQGAIKMPKRDNRVSLSGKLAPASGHSRSALMQRLTELSEVEDILRLIESRNHRTRTTQPGDWTPPRTPVESLMADLWMQVLKIDRVSVHDDFFKLGGHSLLGTLLVSRIHGAFQVELPLSSLFEAPTLAELSEVVETYLIQDTDADVISELLAGLDNLTDEEVKELLTAEATRLDRKQEPQ